MPLIEPHLDDALNTVSPPEPRSLLFFDGTNWRVARVDTHGRVQVRGEDQLFSFHDTLQVRVFGVISGAGGYVRTGLVPAGEIWVVTHVQGLDVTSAVTAISADRLIAAAAYTFATETRAIAAGERVAWLTEVYCREDDRVELWFTGALAGDTCELVVLGYVMTLET